MTQQLRPEAKDEAFDQLSTIRAGIERSRWQWCLERDDGSLIAAAMIYPDGINRGWVAGFPAANMRAVEIRPLLRLFTIYCRMMPKMSLRAWIDANDQRAITFAKAFGLAYDCGPAVGLSQDGRDMNLYLRKGTP